ncbi:MAG: DUF4956 domain-containing protein [Clostridia bacterium]|jgi:hypothetical protein|nr:DUF4956 domain-containing protein [Clostridia bacterium]MBQ5991874.1 DUF4956 domain-containing protein [Clostridia bacterium]MDO4836687.1 DUF4956 domain-containing protein [Clostridia bacterium]
MDLSNTFKEIFNFSTNQVVPLLVTVVLAFVIGLFVYLIYRLTFSGVIYSKTFNMSLVMLTMVTTMVILIMSNNVKLSLGMVGALSIVRFRTAIKDPIDTVFMFWAIAEGIVLGAGFYLAAIVGAILIGVFMLLLASSKKKASLPYLLILHYEERASKQIKSMVAQIPYARVKSKTVQREGIELAVELRIRSSETGFVDKFLRVDGVYDATLIAHQGDMIS